MASAAVNRDFVSAVIDELALGIDNAVECWMAKVEQALTDPRLTTLGRLNAAREVLENYKCVTGKALLGCRRGTDFQSRGPDNGSAFLLPDGFELDLPVGLVSSLAYRLPYSPFRENRRERTDFRSYNLKPGLLESHLVETNAAQEPPSYTSIS